MKCKFPPCSSVVPPAKPKGKDRSYCSMACVRKDAVNRLRKKRKIIAVQYLGGKCLHCGFDRHIAALQFHHRDPDKKEFTINRGITMSMDRIKKELDKCDLLCANCHFIEHARIAETAQALL